MSSKAIVFILYLTLYAALGALLTHLDLPQYGMLTMIVLVSLIDTVARYHERVKVKK